MFVGALGGRDFAARAGKRREVREDPKVSRTSLRSMETSVVAQGQHSLDTFGSSRTPRRFPARAAKSLPPSAPTNNLKNFLYFTSKCLVGITFLSAIQAGSQSKDTSWTVLTGVDFNDRLIIYSTWVVSSSMRSLTVPPNLLIFSTCILCCALTSILVIK